LRAGRLDAGRRSVYFPPDAKAFSKTCPGPGTDHVLGPYRIVQNRLFESDFDRVVAETRRLAEQTDVRKPGRKKERKP